MKKRLKGLISWWLVLAMIFSSVTVSFAAETAEVQSTNAEYYIGSDSLDSGYSVEDGESTYLKLYYGDGAATLTEQVSSLEEANRPENKILIGWKLWGMHYYGDLDAGPIEKSLTDVVTAEDVENCLNGSDNYYDPLVEPHYVDKYIIDPQPTNETFTVGGKEYNIDDGEYYETADVTYQWHLWETVPYTVVNTVEDETTEIAKSYTWKLTFSEGKWLTTANSTYSQISIAAQAGDIIDIKFDSEFSGTVSAYYSSGDYEYNAEAQSYRYTVSEDRDVYAYIRPEDTSIQHTFTMSVLRSSVGESIVGENGATLTSGEDGNSYLCQLTFGQSDDTVDLYSDAVEWGEPEILHEHPICGDAECASHGSGVAYTAWDGTGTPSGNVYLTDNVTLSESLIISSGTVNLCLNGHTITITNSLDALYVESGATLNICDCSTNQSGKIEKTGASADYPGILNRGGTVNVYSGTVSSSNNSNGIYNYSGTVNVYSGTVSSSQRYGINNKGTVNVYGGTVSGIYSGINNKGTVNVYGGTVSSSYSNGIYNDANLNIYGGTVSGISSGINNGADGEITVSGGTVTSEGDAGTGIYNYGEVTVSGEPVITGNSAGIYLVSGKVITGALGTFENPISVKMNTPGTFTTGWTTKMGENADNYGSYFTSADSSYTVQPDGRGELQLVEKPAHVCQWNYSIKADYTDTIVATCIGEGECTSTANKELTIIVPAHAEVNDGEEAAATLSATSIGGITELPDIVYYKYSQYPTIDESSATTTPFENVGGTYKAQITVGGVTAYANYTIDRLARANIKQFTVSDVTVNSFVINLHEDDWSKTDFVCEFGSDKIEFTPDTNGRATITVPDVYAGSNNLWVFVYQKQTDIYKKSNTKDTTVSLKNPEYTVIFNANGGTCETASAETIDGKLATLPDATRVGYIFNGWFDASEGGNKITTETEFTSDTTLIAQWQSIYKDYALLQNDIDHVREVLSGIAEVTEKDGTIVIKLTQDVMGRIRFDKNSGIFKLNLNGHTITPGTQNEALCLDNGFTGTVTVTGDGTLKKGVNNIIYNWKATLNFAVVEGKEYFSLKNGDSNIFSEKNTGTKEYTRTFTSSGDSFALTQGMLGSYMVIFNASSGNGTMANQTIKELMPTTLSENTFTREGYTFAGWATSANGTKVYDDKQSVTDIAAAGESITLFAVWNKIPANAPAITSQPQGFEDANALTYANIGTDKKLSVETDADENEYIVTYQWYKNTTDSKDGAAAVGTEKDLAIENGLNAGDYYYYCKITVTRKDNGESTSVDTELVKVTVNKATVAVPTAASKVYTGSTLKADISETADYTVTTNNGGITVGQYDVVLNLKDSANYKWSDGTETAAKTIKFEIKKATENAIKGLAIEDWTYGESPKTPSASATFGTPAFTYVGTGGTNYAENATPPANAGTYKVIAKVADTTNYEGASDEMEFAIAKAIPSVSAPTAKTGLVYNGADKALVSAGTTSGGEMQYSLDGSTWATEIPQGNSAGSYTVYYKVVGGINYNDNVGGTVQVTIAKAAPSLNAPEAITNLIYNGTTQRLTTNGTVAGGEIQFSTSENGTYAPAIITGENAGNYEVWYKIIGDNNHTDIAPVKLDISIAQKSVEGANVGSFNALTYTGSEQTPVASVTIDGLTATGTWSNVTKVADTTTFIADGNFTGTIAEQSTGMVKATPSVSAPTAKTGLVYNGADKALVSAGTTSGGTMQYSLDNISWSNDIPSGTNAGDYTIYYRVVGNSNYNDVAAQSISVSIENADMLANITANGYNGVFDNQAHTISVAIPDGASIKYGTDDGTYELVAAPQYTNVGTYKVYYKVEKANYNAVTGSADVVITAKDISNAEITLGEALTYTGNELTRDFTVALLDGLVIDYTISGNTGINAGNYELTISGQYNFAGTKSVNWSISKASQPAPETPAAVNETIKAKADGKITGVNFDMEYKLEGASEYIAISETEIANLAAGTYLVRYKENANHLAGADKQLIIADGAMITASFNSNEGTAVDSITCEYNQAITAPAEPTKENFVFAGWYKDAECLDLWNFGNALTEDITLYAKWNDKPVYSVSGKVTDGEFGLGGITVTLKQGNTIIATTTTAADGSYSFITEDGLYNIVAEKKENDNSTIKTVKIEVIESANVNDVVFVATDINSELEIKPYTPQIIVGGLDEEAKTVSSSYGDADVTVKMTVESKEDITGSDDATGQEQRQTEQKEIKKVSGNRYIQFIEINLTQSISGAGSTKLEETSGLIEIIIPFEKGNKRNITVYRYHGSVAEKLGAGIGNANADDEYFEVKENHIVVYAKKFSTYAIGYDLPSSGGGGSSVTRYTVKFDTNGGSSVSSATVTKNAKVAEPKTPEKDGYTFGGWYTDKEFAEKYDFESKVTKNFTLYAKWDKHDDEQSSTDTHNCPSLAFDDLDITKWYHFDTDYVIENGIFKGTTETTFEPDSAQTRAMMVTVLYRVEGEPAVNRSIPFADVDMGAYYANAVIWGQQNGIIKGYSETEFGPDDKITREQIAAIMHRYAQYKGIDVSVGENTNILSYDDFDSISEYAIPSMQWAVGSGLIKGKSESTLNPLDNATRAEIAAILHRFIEVN